jgi:hypothetical protein
MHALSRLSALKGTGFTAAENFVFVKGTGLPVP